MGGYFNSLLKAFNMDLGVWIANPSYGLDKSECDLRRFVPFPIYPLLPGDKRNRDNCRIYLSDGGHSDNLAAYSAIRRLPEVLVIVDGSRDADSKFDELKELSIHLHKENNLYLNMDKIHFCKEDKTGSCNIWNEIEDFTSFERQDKKTFIERPVSVKNSSVDTYDVYKSPLDTTILEGCITNFEGNGNDCNDNTLAYDQFSIKVFYIKLSLPSGLICKNGDENAICKKWDSEDDKYGVNDILARINTDDGPLRTILGRFPHNMTFDIQYSPRQYRGYRQLGYFLSRHSICGDGELCHSRIRRLIKTNN